MTEKTIPEKDVVEILREERRQLNLQQNEIQKRMDALSKAIHNFEKMKTYEERCNAALLELNISIE